MTETKNILKFDPKLGLEKHLTGESGCARCGCSIAYGHLDDGYYGWYHPSHLVHKDTCKKHPCLVAEPKKSQTIRNKPAMVGDVYTAMSMWSGMERGMYCPMRLEPEGKFYMAAKKNKMPFHIHGLGTHPSQLYRCSEKLEEYPKKLFDVEITASIEYHMKLSFEKDALMVVKRIVSLGSEIIIPQHILTYTHPQSPFVKADWPDATNAQFIDFMLKFKPEIKEKWTPMWLWKFRRIG